MTEALSENPSMRRLQRLIAFALLITLCGVLTGCGSFGSSWDPMDMLDFLDTKKKLPGERKPVFPEGVPGLEPGVPKELYKGNVERQQPQDAATLASPPPAAEEPKPAPRSAKSRSKPTAVTAAPAQEPDAAPTEEEGATPAIPPEPKPKKPVRRRTTSLPKDDAATQPAPAQPPQQPQQQAQPSPFPAPMPSGTFTR
jgi:hypothetical protein